MYNIIITAAETILYCVPAIFVVVIYLENKNIKDCLEETKKRFL